MVKDAKVHIYELSNNGALNEKKKLQQGGAISSVNFSPDGKYLVATDIAKKVAKYSFILCQSLNSFRWCHIP